MKAYMWLMSDPSYINYTEYRKMQRFGLANLLLTGLIGKHGMTRRYGFRKKCMSATTMRIVYNRSVICKGDVMGHLVLNFVPYDSQLPPELCLLTKLQSIDITANHLKGPIPTEIGWLSDLK